MNKNLQWWGAWLFFSLLTITIAMLYESAAFVDGQYIPVGNDSFYHARRIIDAAIGERGFYQFDPWIHVPEGSWLNWPWAYDWLLAQALRIALWLRPDLQPMQFLAYVPVAWAPVNAGLLTLIMRQTKLSSASAVIGLLAFALLPLTQNLHGLGLIDHHFIELSFVLLTVLFGQRFFELQRNKDGLILGVVLGSSIAFHNGLFILQIPVLLGIFLLWMRSAMPPRTSVLWLAGSLFATVILVALPSEPIYDGQFEFWTLSWFHLYVSLGSAIALSFFGLREFSAANLGALLAAGVALLLPVLAPLVVGVAFVSGELDIIADISEAQSPLSRVSGTGGVAWVTSLYGWLILTAPILILGHTLRLFREHRPLEIFTSVMVVFGLVLMLSQYRLHPFGSWAIIVGGLLFIERLRLKFGASSLVSFAVTLAVLAAALQPALRNQLFVRAPPGLDRDYAATRSLYPALAAACEQAPGSVLALADDGHPIRYHTECDVLVNNFLMTPLHAQKLQEQAIYLAMTPAELARETNIRYVFVRIENVFHSTSEGFQATPIDVLRQTTSPLFFELAFTKSPPTGYRLISEVRFYDERDFAFGRVFEILRAE